MAEELEHPPRAYNTEDVATQAPAPKKHRLRWKRYVALGFLIPILLFVLYGWLSLTFSYGHGERSGYVQKFAKEGWVCKTWEGELAMANLPGTMPQIFRFTVRDEAVAKQIEQNMGKRVALTFEEHRGVPTTCFGDTEFYVTSAQVGQ
ncbi:MAG TPA: hypothetical protein VN607_07400 [Gemmatimonadaceae bacterium]|nr:hypothetical protein [Gemmatimonadaceae bacterium]